MATTVYPPYTEAAAFTRAQWKELERQAMIYKYMVASVPVPPHLLSSDFTTATTTSLDHHGYSSIFNMRYGDNKDPEPGRCKRTDGKKWRCSRDVAPQQKYCERHMHRGRPRSRKPVEPLLKQQEESSQKTNKKTRLVSTAAPPPASPRFMGSTNELNNNNNPSSLLLKTVNKTDDVSLSLFTQNSQNREMEWMMENKMMTMETSEQQWHQLMNQGSVYNTSQADPSIFQHSNNYEVEEQQLNLLSLPQLGNSSTDDYNLFMNTYNPPRDFIDAWSNDNSPHSENIKNDSCSGINNGNLSPCSLNLSMAMGVNDSEMGQIQMMEEGSDTNQRCEGMSWSSPVSWMVSAPGGPLAEVLRPSNVIVNSNPGSPCAGKECDEISPQATSPSGVLHRTMLSLSDNSVCNSPTVAAAPEIVGFQWLN
ncbi:growth-regulating factor 7-like [Apium graveolens]|uniref:growth-regulating factor 7-like n=1 Tax=Apium graveolens TaxID=4045 RepID=UPI003D7C140B